MNDEKLIEFLKLSAIHSGILNRVGSLLLMHTLMENKLSSFSGDVKWYDKNDSHDMNKHRMKETGGMLNGYRKSAKELLIIGLSKTIEDLLFDLENTLQVKLKFWKDFDEHNYYDEMKLIRHLNNCIKHSKGTIKRGNHSNDYLIEIVGLKEESTVNDFQIDIENYILKSFIFQMDVFYLHRNQTNPYLNLKDKYNEIRKQLIPDFIENMD